MPKKKKAKKKLEKKRKIIKRKPKPKIKEVHVEYGGVIKTAPFENRRVRIGMDSNCPQGLGPRATIRYLTAICQDEYYGIQIQAIEGLSAEIRDQLGDFVNMTPREASGKIDEFFHKYRQEKRLTPKKRAKQIEKLQKELKDLSGQIRAENKRLKGIIHIDGKDLERRHKLTERRKEIKKELNFLRKG